MARRHKPRLVPRFVPRVPFRGWRGNNVVTPIILAVVAFAGVSSMLSGGNTSSAPGGAQAVAGVSAGEHRLRFSMCGATRVTCVVDGDTIWLNGVNLRLESYDTPEPYDQICGGANEVALAHKASARLLQLLNSNAFSIETSGQDRYGRTLGTLRIGGQDVGDILIREGLARSWPNGREFWC